MLTSEKQSSLASTIQKTVDGTEEEWNQKHQGGKDTEKLRGIERTHLGQQQTAPKHHVPSKADLENPALRKTGPTKPGL